MKSRRLDIVLRSTTGLKKTVHAMSTRRTGAYAVAWIEPNVRVPSPLRHGRNPVWDTTISIAVDVDRSASAKQWLHIEVLAQGLTPMGFVRVDVTDRLLHCEAVRAPFHDHPAMKRSGRQQRILNFELCLQTSSTSAY